MKLSRWLHVGALAVFLLGTASAAPEPTYYIQGLFRQGNAALARIYLGVTNGGTGGNTGGVAVAVSGPYLTATTNGGGTLVTLSGVNQVAGYTLLTTALSISNSLLAYLSQTNTVLDQHIKDSTNFGATVATDQNHIFGSTNGRLVSLTVPSQTNGFTDIVRSNPNTYALVVYVDAVSNSLLSFLRSTNTTLVSLIGANSNSLLTFLQATNSTLVTLANNNSNSLLTFLQSTNTTINNRITALKLSDLADAQISGVAAGNIIAWSGSKWTNGAPASSSGGIVSVTYGQTWDLDVRYTNNTAYYAVISEVVYASASDGFSGEVELSVDNDLNGTYDSSPDIMYFSTTMVGGQNSQGRAMGCIVKPGAAWCYRYICCLGGTSVIGGTGTITYYH